MTIEALLKEHIDALNANTEALKSFSATGAAPAPAEASAEKAKPEAAAAKTTRTRATAAKKATGKTVEEASAALVKLKDEFGIEHAKSVLKESGFSKMAELTPEKADAVFKSAEAKYAELQENDGEEEEEGDDDI